jgi:WD40 repeat protein
MESIKNEINLIGHDNTVRSVTFHQEKPFLATGSDDETAKLWNFSSNGLKQEFVATLEGHSDGVNSVAFSHNGIFLATGSSDKTVKL